MTSNMRRTVSEVPASTKSKNVGTFDLRRTRLYGILAAMNEIPPPIPPEPSAPAPLPPPPPIAVAVPPPAPPAKQRSGCIVYSVIVSFFLVLSILANIVLFGFAFTGFQPDDGVELRKARLSEAIVQGEPSTRTKIAVIYISGIISSTEDGFPSEEGMVGYIKDQLEQAVDDDHVKAIILRINSPGGEVVASDEIYQAVVKANEVKPVITSMDTVAASGGYYIAVGSRHIVANELTITGSIGVIMQTFGFAGLMDKVGVKSYTFKSGKYKDLLNPTREPTPGETALVSNLVMEVYDKFVGIVSEERDINEDELQEGIADGRILSGKQALAAKLVDELGYFDDAVNAAIKHARLDPDADVKLIRYAPRFTLRNLLRIFGKNEAPQIQVQLTPNTLKLTPGHLYFLPAYMFQ
jgi:protease-4